jgi:hypothetical protein
MIIMMIPIQMVMSLKLASTNPKGIQRKMIASLLSRKVYIEFQESSRRKSLTMILKGSLLFTKKCNLGLAHFQNKSNKSILRNEGIPRITLRNMLILIFLAIFIYKRKF